MLGVGRGQLRVCVVCSRSALPHQEAADDADWEEENAAKYSAARKSSAKSPSLNRKRLCYQITDISLKM
jgi:hypothetical protein